jgi:hypothetical protein
VPPPRSVFDIIDPTENEDISDTLWSASPAELRNGAGGALTTTNGADATVQKRTDCVAGALPLP